MSWNDHQDLGNDYGEYDPEYERPLKKRWYLRLLKALLLPLLGALIIFLYYFLSSAKYDLSEVQKMPQRTLLYDRNGLELDSIHGANRRLITYDQIPPFFIQALLAREDTSFLEHHGVDYRGLVRSTLRNLKDLSFTQGASTLTMQLARNTYPLKGKSIHRKLLEISLAYRLERNFTKKEILTAYLNRIYFGSGSHGLGEAAHTYFARPAQDLTKNQSALLAGIIRAPHAFSPLRNIDLAATQRDQVLRRLISLNTLTLDEAKKIQATPLALTNIAQLKKNPETAHLHAVSSTRRHLNEILNRQQLEHGGLQVHTTLDRDLQKKINLLLTTANASDAPLQAAAIALDLRTGGMSTVIGSRNYTHSPYNRAFDSQRELGPAARPLLYAALAHRGKKIDPANPLTTLRQLPTTETVRILKRLGLPASTFDNITSDAQIHQGNFTASPLQLATALATITSPHQAGKRPRTYLIQKVITNSNGTKSTYFANHQKFTPVLNKATPPAVQSALPLTTCQHFTTPNQDNLWTVIRNEHTLLVLWFGYDQPKKIYALEELKHQLTTSLPNILK